MTVSQTSGATGAYTWCGAFLANQMATGRTIPCRLLLVNVLLYIVLGCFFIWAGTLQLIGAMVPKDTAIQMAEVHGRWVRENVLHLPPHDCEKHLQPSEGD